MEWLVKWENFVLQSLNFSQWEEVEGGDDMGMPVIGIVRAP